MTDAPIDDLLPLSPLDFHVLMVLWEAPLYGYAIMKAVEEESGGALTPEIGSLYRVLARLASAELVDEAPPPADASGSHPGRERRYYALTRTGRAVVRAEAGRLRDALAIAERRALLPERGRP